MNLVTGWEEVKGVFWIVSVISIAIAVTTYFVLKRKNWF